MEVNNNISENIGGLHSDASPQNQPKGSQRFALNVVNESEHGDEPYRSNEESNEVCTYLKEDFIPLDKCYIGNKEVIVFSVKKDNSISEIGILSNSCVYTVHVNDEFSTDKLGFTVEHQINSTYRLRRGCERTVYWTDDNEKPRYYNFDKPEDFKDKLSGEWEATKFNLFKEYSKIPEFRAVEVLDSGGNLKSGSYNMSIRYVDEGLNPSEWIITSPIINIYNDLKSEAFLNIRGSITSDVDYLNFPISSKAIRVEFDNLDDNYPFYQIAFIEATNGSGMVSDVKYTDTIPTSKDFYIYTGDNITVNGTEEEILFFNEIIYRANSIEQIENRLLLANTEGKNVDFCKLQKYASRIKADVVTKKVIVNDINDPRNTKNPTMHFGDMITGGTGYMPGEIYSFGINYVFTDGSMSPTYHIPGKNPSIHPSTIFTSGPATYPMSQNNESQNNTYIDNDNCSSNDYWGLDSEGDSLSGRPVRHHRFPLRSEIGLSLITEEAATPQTFPYFKLQFNANGTTPLPCTQDMIDAGECGAIVVAPPFQARVSFTVDGSPETLVMNIDTNIISNPVNVTVLSNLYSSNAIVITGIEESDGAGGFYDVLSYPSAKGLTYSTNVIPADFTTEGKIFSTEILGIKFSGVDLPSLVDTNGNEVIGYYIVRNDRVENEKTILDSAVLTPSLKNNKYISHGLLQPVVDPNRISKDVFGMIHPEHKFNEREYTNYTSIIQEGNFQIVKRNYSKIRYNDCFDGSSYDSSIHKEGNDDGNNLDGWGVTSFNRDQYTHFVPRTNFEIDQTQIKEKFYLKALQSRDINDGANAVYNIAGDNRVGMIQLKANNLINPITENLPYVLLKRDIADSYSTFRTLPYYKDSINMETADTASIFSGDTYVAPMRYTNSIWWDNRPAERAGKTSVWNYIIGGILIVIGAILLIFGGSGAIVIGAGIAIIGGGALFISSGIERDALVKAYQEEYSKGLRETALDNITQLIYRDNVSLWGTVGEPYTTNGPSDDEIQWIGDTVTDLWFESQVNISLRHKMTSDVPTFLDAPGVMETGNSDPYIGWEFFGKWYENSVSRYPISKMDNHMAKKLLAYNSNRKDNRQYIGHSLGEWYKVNPDFHRKNTQKIFYHLPLEYDCCSDCKEDFPHRWHWSEQSFQEELTDNYRTFLPNNYKDLEGETGEITNVFKIGNNLFMHTQEALWQIPRNYQERVTDQIVSFIGTGSYGEIPAQKVLDDDTGSSAGSQHKWGMIKTPNGVFFPSESQRKIYQFDGKQLKPISNIGISNWFQNNMKLAVDEQYYNAKQTLYPYRNNPSNPFGSGFISTYDTTKERIIFTKKDFLLSQEVVGNEDFEICVNSGQMTIFPDFGQTINDQALLGWNYVGIENCKLKFEKTKIVTTTETRQIVLNVPNNADIIIWLDTSGSFDTSARNQIKSAVNSWLVGFGASNPNWVGNLHFIEAPGAGGGQTERWMDALRYTRDTIYGGNVNGKNIILVNFVNESTPEYHTASFDGNIDNPSVEYLNDYNAFVNIHDNEIIANGGSFIGLSYPIVFTAQANLTSEFLKTVLAAVKGISYGTTAFGILTPNPACPSWAIMETALKGTNPYPDNGIGGLDQYGWNVITNRFYNGSGAIITAENFQEDMKVFLESNSTVETIEVEVSNQETEYMYIDGVPVEDPLELENSWTISFSLKQNTWVSWHSYLPNFYINVPDKFYSWKYGSDAIWKHNKKGHYQTFYGKLYPFILEYVSLSNLLSTRIWDYLTFLVESKRFDFTTNEFVDVNDVFFNKLIAYNSRQCTGLLNTKLKNNYLTENYLYQQVENLTGNEILVDRNERNWSLNELRDVRTDYSKPIFISELSSLQNEYFIDKIVNTATINFDKDWTQLESFRDKYLVVRLIFDKFADTKMIMNFSVENETQSFR